MPMVLSSHPPRTVTSAIPNPVTRISENVGHLTVIAERDEPRSSPKHPRFAGSQLILNTPCAPLRPGYEPRKTRYSHTAFHGSLSPGAESRPRSDWPAHAAVFDRASGSRPSAAPSSGGSSRFGKWGGMGGGKVFFTGRLDL